MRSLRISTAPAAHSLRQRPRWFKSTLYSAAVAAALGCFADAQSSSPRRPIATLAGVNIYEDDLPSRVIGQLLEARQHEYELTTKALQEVAGQKLLEALAKENGITPEKLLENEVDNKVGEPTLSEAEAFYLGQRDQSQPFEQLKGSIIQDLKRARIQAARDNFLSSLRESSELVVLLPRPRVDVGYDPARIQGMPDAPVMIVEFSDFSCPFCRQAESTLKQLANKYAGTVSLAYRDFPLRERHRQAQIAAEASRCAAEQRRFWEYHDLLFENPDKQDDFDLLQFAEKLGLDRNQFDSCLSSGKYKPRIEQDVQDGRRVGVSATPAFFINGIFLLGARPASEFEKIIDEQLQSVNRGGARK